MESLKIAQERKNDTFKQLQKQSRNDVADVLGDCSPKHPCNHALCPVCKRSVRTEIFEALETLLRKYKKQGFTLYAVTLIESKTPEFNGTVRQAKNTLPQRLKRLFGDKVIVVGCFDLCLNQDALQEWKPFWHKHFHLIFISKLVKEEIAMLLKKYYPSTGCVKRPVRVVKVRTFKRTLTYVLPAPYFPRRVRFLNTKSAQRKPFLTAKEYPLKSKELAELSDRIRDNKVTDFIFQYGVRL